jgi:steroid delta-isomerase-like uncharacterized protein
MADSSQAADEQLLRDYADLWNEGDYARIPDLVAESITLDPSASIDGTLEYPETVRGRDEFEAYLRGLREGFPDFHVTIDGVLREDDIAMTKWTVTGTHDGEFAGFQPTGREMRIEGMDRIRVADGTVQDHRVYYDTRTLMEQLGLADE